MARRTRTVTALALATSSLVAGVAASTELPTDPATGLVMDENWQIVAAHCGACHSTRLVTQNRGGRETWLHMIRWMQDSQGLWPFNEPTETMLLDYLEKNYGPLAASRRQPLPPALMPPPIDGDTAGADE
jgi:hypothetical protein